jgi:16S rRNA (uracil1498-N3)-methyltransferase
VNILLLERDEIGSNGVAVVHGRRAEHVRTVLKKQPGDTLRAGILDGELGRAEVLAIAPERLEVATRFGARPPATDDVLLLAVPRPKVLLRLLAQASSLGFERIVLFRSWRVEKAHLESRAVEPATMRLALIAGLEQAGRTKLPSVELFRRFRPFAEDTVPALALPTLRFVAHPFAPTATADLARLPAAPLALALGPEGGLLPFEVDLLAHQGFLPIHCGPWPLRTETALAVLSGQLALLRPRTSLST